MGSVIIKTRTNFFISKRKSNKFFELFFKIFKKFLESKNPEIFLFLLNFFEILIISIEELNGIHKKFPNFFNNIFKRI